MSVPRPLSRCCAAALVAGAALVAAPAPASASDIAFGEYLAGECATCHRRAGAAGGIPAITGWPRGSFIAVLNSYRSRERDNVVMQTIAGRLTDDEMAALAAYFETIGQGAPAAAK